MALAAGWQRLPRVRWARAVCGFVLVLFCQVVAIAAAGVYANNAYGFYNSWADLMGTQNQAPQVVSVNRLLPKDGSLGRIVTLSVPTPPLPATSRAPRKLTVLAWLPKQYGEPQYAHTRFPVTMMMPGQPGTPQGIFSQFLFGSQATKAIDQHHVAPFVAILPPLMLTPPRDTECADVTRGPQAETWLYRNVRDAAIRHLRVTPDGRRWSAMGFSTGGFCAAKLLFRHPTLFHAAVGLAGYYGAETDHNTGRLYTTKVQRQQNSPIYLVGRDKTTPRRLLIVVSRVDRHSYDGVSYANSKAMIEATQGVPGVATLVLPQGGHNYRVYRATLPKALTWLGQNAGL